MLNESALDAGAGSVSSVYISQSQLLESLENTTNATQRDVAISLNASQGWEALYNSSVMTNDTAGELIFQGTDPEAFYDFEVSEAGSSSLNLVNGTVNGFTFTYANESEFGTTAIVLVGYKGDYVVSFFLHSTNSGVYNGTAIADQISSTL